MVTWLVEHLDTICLILGLLLTTLGTVLSIISKNSVAGKSLKAMGNIVAHLPSFIRTAEKLGGTGEEKKAYVLEQVLLYFRAEKVEPTQEQLLDISKQVDDQVKLTKDLHVVSTVEKYVTNPFMDGANKQ